MAYNNGYSSLDPMTSSSGSDQAILWPIFDTLITFTPDLQPKPGLAKSWEFTDDQTLTLHLQEGVKFHDGTSFDAEAVKFNIVRMNSKDSKTSDLKNVENVEVVDPSTVKLHLKQPDSSLILALSDRGGMMVSPTAVKEKGENFSQNPVGAGPYKLVKQVPNGEVVYEAFENYWQEGLPYLDKITVKIMPEENTRINSLKSGEVDFAFDISPGNVKTLKNNPNIEMTEILPLLGTKMYINSSMEPFNNKAVRLAVQHGINREALISALNFGSGEPAAQAFPSDYWAADSSMKIEYDPEMSKKLLQEAGLKNVSFTMNHFAKSYETRLAEAIKSQLKDIGIEVKLQPLEITAAAASFYSEKEVPAYLASWSGRADPQMTVSGLYSKNSFFKPGGHSRPDLEELISKAASTYDQDQRAELYKEISRIAVLEEAESIPLFFTPMVAAMNKQIKGYEHNKLGKPIFSTLWLEE
ncbi:ABC transporter substrate-binding protein [Neobacillus rhizophilus]|uniref:ABC transporter substrate-binding protein n=1 Tax=Neobacillus rhizophilus TaxID=2833579 RepID=UPI002016FAF9|nr:ABC transporter substrate-binding protein [Neobacillus rhizophilus]